MGGDNFLVDTDVLIAYSTVTKNAVLSKPGLKASERSATLAVLRRFRQLRVDSRVARAYAELRASKLHLAQADALIAATALARKLTVLARNVRHFRRV